jgi:hypothetical protein
MSNSSGVVSRSGIACNSDVPATAPIRFYCDLNNNQIGGEANDGKELGCSCLAWADLAAYLVWAGLRPITELEYEKCGRGNLPPIAAEYAWGNRFVTLAKVIIDLGLSTERTNPDANANCGGWQSGPMRNGAFATSGSSREQAGAGYYGVMELCGNLFERCISLATSSGRAFAGTHGDGKLGPTGFVTVKNQDWPPNSGDGADLRGGTYNSTILTDMEISNRGNATFSYPTRLGPFGGRGARTAQ